MKIMQIIPSLGVGGAENVCESLTNEMKEKGNQVVVVSLFSEETILTTRMKNSGHRILFLDKHNGLDFACVSKLRRLIRNEKPDVIHTHLHSLKYAVLATIGMNIRIIHTVHNVAKKESNRFDRFFNRIFFRHQKAIPVALSDEIQNTIVEEYKLRKESVPVVLNGVNLKRCLIKKDYSIQNPLKVIHVGRFYEQKNHAYMIESISRLKDILDIHLCLYGDGPLMQDCIDMVARLGLDKEIEFMGVSDNVFPCLNSSDIFILPSKWEGMPISIIEAMGTGLPIIASSVGGVPEMLEYGNSGLLLSEDKSSLMDALIQLAEDEEMRSRLGTNALNKSKEFSSETMAEKYLYLYQNQGN